MDKDGSTSRTPSNLYSVKRNLSVPIALGLPSALAGRRRASLSTCNIVETTKISRDFDKDTGNKTINQYMIVRELGRGAEGKVKLVVDTVTNELWAIKIVSKTQKRSQISKLSAAYRLGQDGHLAKVRKEIAILKKCRHDHIVALKEVIDDPLVDKIYMVLEYLEGGEVKWQNPKGPPGPSIPLSQCASIFRDLVCGLQYLHCQGIVHRDIKPANLLWTKQGRVKISDFGTSVFVGNPRNSSMNRGGDLGLLINSDLSKTAGSPAFFAPELCSPLDDTPTNELDYQRPGRVIIPSTKAGSVINPPIGATIDIWATGITLYCLVYEFELFQIIAKEQVTFPALPSVPNSLKNLLTSLLQKDFKLRITMEGIRHHPWVLSGLSNSSRAKFLHDTDPSCDSIQPIVVSEEEVKNAVGIMGKIKKRMRKMSTSLSGLLGYSTRQPKNGSRPNLEVSSSQPDTSTNLFSHLTLDDPVAAEKERILQWNTFSQ